jgi:hypothetical protein
MKDPLDHPDDVEFWRKCVASDQAKQCLEQARQRLLLTTKDPFDSIPIRPRRRGEWLSEDAYRLKLAEEREAAEDQDLKRQRLALRELAKAETYRLQRDKKQLEAAELARDAGNDVPSTPTLPTTGRDAKDSWQIVVLRKAVARAEADRLKWTAQLAQKPLQIGRLQPAVARAETFLRHRAAQLEAAELALSDLD